VEKRKDGILINVMTFAFDKKRALVNTECHDFVKTTSTASNRLHTSGLHWFGAVLNVAQL